MFQFLGIRGDYVAQIMGPSSLPLAKPVIDELLRRPLRVIGRCGGRGGGAAGPRARARGARRELFVRIGTQ